MAMHATEVAFETTSTPFDKSKPEAPPSKQVETEPSKLEVATLRINHAKQDIKIVFPNLKKSPSAPAYKLLEHVKNVVLETNTDCIANNGAYTRLCSYFDGHDALFDNASALKLEILASSSNMTMNENEAMNNAALFVTKLRQLVHVCSKVDVAVTMRKSRPNYFASEIAGLVVSRLFSNMSGIGLSVDKQIPNICIDTEHINGLTSLEYTSDRNYAEIHEIITNNQKTLKLLKLNCYVTDLNLFFSNDEGRGPEVQFPSLLELEINGRYVYESPKIHMAAAVPFPNLRRLAIKGEYSFIDDTVFRGNEQTLAELYIIMDAETLELLNEHDVFARGRFKALEKVTVSSNFQDCFESGLPTELYNVISELLISLASQTSSLTYIEEFDTHFEDFIDAFKASKSELGKLKELILPGTRLYQYSVREVKDVFPSLKKLKLEN
ncbi:hypothetical protein H4R99_007570 [Coemansia sp. RSA 1722]|nr:hypothetical protein IWW45_008289 [Coemansia sp. RSA 485]KAJ2589129.1 hypothetical protein H4R99_007570 [Coemansia sp. RSA 1722]